MSRIVNAEATGDWRNFKGDYYHLIYVIWRLLHNPTEAIAFYQGNDLLSISPPTPPGDDQTLLLAKSARFDTDRWIQLKSSPDKWSCRSIFRQVLFNFIYNALTSDSQGRAWEAILVTQGHIPQEQLKKFVRDFQDSPIMSALPSPPTQETKVKAKLRARTQSKVNLPSQEEEFASVVTKAWQVWNEENKADTTKLVSFEAVCSCAFNILTQLSNQNFLGEKQITDDIRMELLRKLSGKDKAASRVEDALIRNLTASAAAGPTKAQFFDGKWLKQIGGPSFDPQGKFDIDPLAACTFANAQFKHKDWDSNYHVPRQKLEAALENFLSSPEPVFSIVGLSGIGKSWILAHILSDLCADRLCLLVRGSLLDDCQSLSELVANQLRPLIQGEESDQNLLHRWVVEGLAKNNYPPLLILDDLIPSPLDPTKRQRQLGQIATQARQAGIKLILASQWHIWRLARLGKELDPGDVFPPPNPNIEAIKDNQGTRPRTLEDDRISYLIEDFSADEIEDAVRKRLTSFPQERIDSIAQQLRSPAFAPLRNPYLLSLYLNDYGSQLQQAGIAPPLMVDELLDKTITLALERIANQLGCASDDIRPGLEALVTRLWNARPNGLSHGETARILEDNCGYQGAQLVGLFRSVAFLGPDAPIRFERTPIVDRLFALELDKKEQAGEDIVNQFHPDTDAGPVSAYLRHLANPTSLYQHGTAHLSAFQNSHVSTGIQPAVALAERLLNSDRQWLRAICDGLAQASPDDLQVVAFLAILCRHSSHDGIEHEACKALGRLAARGGEALLWATEMYNGDSPHDRLRGSIALAELLEFDPIRVGELVSIRLDKVASFDWTDFQQQKHRQHWQRWALAPLTYPRHAKAAHVASEVANSYRYLIEYPSLSKKGNAIRFYVGEPIDWELAEDFAELKGGQIPWNAAIRDQLFEELKSHDTSTRFLAAQALRSLAFDWVELIADVLLERLRLEENGSVLTRLLWASFKLSRQPYTSRFLESIRGGKIGLWNDEWVCGPALVMLGEAAKHDPLATLNGAPRSLEHLPAFERDYNHESLVFLWWSLASGSNGISGSCSYDLWKHLGDLTTLGAHDESLNTNHNPSQNSHDNQNQQHAQVTDYTLTNEDGWPFRAKGAALAQIAIMGRDYISANECQMHELRKARPYYYSNLDDLVAKHSTFLAAHPQTQKLQEILLSCVRAQVFAPLTSKGFLSGPEHKALSDSAFIAARDCLTCLAQLLRHSDDPAPVIRLIPQAGLSDWQQLYLINCLLEYGRRDEELLQMGQELCDSLAHKHTANGAAERETCMAILATILGDGEEEISADEALTHHREHAGTGFFGTIDHTEGFVRLTDQHQDQLLQLLDSNIKKPSDLLTLYQWADETNSWRSLLLARVFKRMFSAQPIDINEAKRLCRGVLVCLMALPESSLRQQWSTIYTTIYSVLDTRIIPGGTLEISKTPLQNSHHCACWLLDQTMEERVTGKQWFNSRLEPSHTLLNASTFSIKEGEVSYNPHGGAKTLVAFPAVRLTAIAIDGGRFETDPIAERMSSREELHQFFDKYGDVYQDYIRPSLPEERKVAALKSLEKILEKESKGEIPRDDLLRGVNLGLTLIVDQPELTRELALSYIADLEERPFTSPKIQAGFWYNLACAQARLGESQNCRESLEKSAEFNPLDGGDLIEDTDLVSVREETWFSDLLERFPPKQNTNEQRIHLIPRGIVTNVETDGNRFTLTFSAEQSQTN